MPVWDNFYGGSDFYLAANPLPITLPTPPAPVKRVSSGRRVSGPRARANKVRRYTMQYLEECTSNFSDSHKIDSTTFVGVDPANPVNRFVVKVLPESFSNGKSRPAQLLARKLESLSIGTHSNILSLIGFSDSAPRLADDCEELCPTPPTFNHGPTAFKRSKIPTNPCAPPPSRHCLVFEYAEHGTLEQFMADNKLTWMARCSILGGVAKALAHLIRSPVPSTAACAKVSPSDVLLSGPFLTPKLKECGMDAMQTKLVDPIDNCTLPPVAGSGLNVVRSCHSSLTSDEDYNVQDFAYLMLSMVTGITDSNELNNLRACLELGDFDCYNVIPFESVDWPLVVKQEIGMLIVGAIQGTLRMTEICDELDSFVARYNIQPGDVGSMKSKKCCICFESTEPCKGDTCSSGHFLCRGCLVKYVANKVTVPELVTVVKERRVRCPWPQCKEAVKEGTIKALCPPKVVAAYMNAITSSPITGKVSSLHPALGDVADATAENIPAMRRHVVENILNLLCPTCGQAFIDFDACFALSCSRCGTGFCGYCLEDCGTDAHQHVAECEHNATPGKQVFGPIDEFHKVQWARRVRMLKGYLGGLDEPVRARLMQALERDINDLMITPADLGL